MDNKVFFKNDGHFDVQSMLTFGVSAKETGSIGYFGTGFKYAIAIILRLGGKISVTTRGENGIEHFEFTKETREIRGQKFDFVLCNGETCGFTTRMGINWEPWMAYRELRCNATDENGDVSTDDTGECDTIIEVDCREIAIAHFEADKHFVSGHIIGTWENVEVYDRPSQHIYYQGVAVHKLTKPSKYAYNIVKPVELTEDRTAKNEYEVRFAVVKCMQMADNEAFLSNILKQDKDSYETVIGFDKMWPQSDAFIQQAMRTQATGNGVSDEVKEIVQAYIDRKGEWPEFELDDVQQKQFEKSYDFLKGIGVDINDYPVKFVKGLGLGVMGRAHKGTIYLSTIPFNHGTKQVASTLLEEWVHLHTGAQDFDRTMQSWLFDKILTIGERLNNDPL